MMRFRWMLAVFLIALSVASAHAAARQQETAPVVHRGGGEASLVLPDLSQVDFLGINARTLLSLGLGVCVLGLLFGLVSYNRLRNLPVHGSMLDVSELIYETCK